MHGFAWLMPAIFVCLGAGASEVIPFKVEEKEQDFVSKLNKFVVPLLPGNGIVVLVERELRWYGDDGVMRHCGTLRDQKLIHTTRLIRYTATGFAYPNEKNEVVIVDSDGTVDVLSGLAEAQLFIGVDGNLAAVSSMTPEGRVIQVVQRNDRWLLGEEKQRQQFEDAFVLQVKPLTVAHVDWGNNLDMLPANRVLVVKDGKSVWQSSDLKWRCVGVLPGPYVVLVSPDNVQTKRIAVVDSDGKLRELSNLGDSTSENVILDRDRQNGIIVVGDWQEPEKYRYRSFSPDGKSIHDFSQFRTFGFPIYGSSLVFFSGRNALADPFSGKVVWHNQKEHYFIAKDESPRKSFMGAQGDRIAWCLLFLGENPFVRVRPISDEDAQQHPVTGKGEWRFVGYDGSIWLYSQTSIYRISL